MDSMNGLLQFINNNYLPITVIIVLVLGLLLIINIEGIDLNTPKLETHLVQQVTVETFSENSLNNINETLEQLKLQPAESFCQGFLGNSSELEPACNQLTETNCADVKCCVFSNGKCVAGDINGPTYKTDPNGKLITMDTYYYLGKKHTRDNIVN